ncbi:response regulator [Gracilibacillus suaedae]|uniref:response regulator n=1 Tax=Gracilibacillus suaedae TaxID=2820273 RepID=UPI001E3FAB36|nr:response regulator [Gracilibacillus suaedae]
MEYWKVLIADDEFIIRDGIMSSVDWGDFNMEVVAEAEDGEEAVNLAIRHEVDVLLIDLNMPIMNGITAMKKIKDQLHDCRMVVISGYDDFQYAQEAIRLQVEDYLLKPVNPNQLANILEAVRQQLDQKKQEENYLQQASSQVKRNHKQLRNRFFLDWMTEVVGEEEVKNQLKFLELPQTEPQSLIVMKWLDGEAEHHFFSEQERKQQLEAIQQLLGEDMKKYVHAIFLEGTHWISILIWEQTPADLTLHLEEFIKEELAQHVYAKQIEVEFSSIPAKYSEVKQELNKYMQLSPLVKQSIQYIRKHYRDSHLTLESIAESLHVSTVYLSKMIKQDLGVSYVKFVTQMRLQTAKDLLRTTDLSVREVAELVGYDSQHYFSTAFRKSIGVTPKQYKHQL